MPSTWFCEEKCGSWQSERTVWPYIWKEWLCIMWISPLNVYPKSLKSTAHNRPFRSIYILYYNILGYYWILLVLVRLSYIYIYVYVYPIMCIYNWDIIGIWRDLCPWPSGGDKCWNGCGHNRLQELRGLWVPTTHVLNIYIKITSIVIYSYLIYSNYIVHMYMIIYGYI